MAEHLDKLASFVAGAKPGDVDDRALRQAKLVLADCVAAMVGGSAEPEMRRLCAGRGSEGEATVVGTGTAADPATAAFLNGTAGTFLEMDEGNQFAKGHPGIHVAPALLAHAESRGLAGGELLLALVVGYEVAARVGIAASLRPSMHPHGTWGIVGAVAGLARLSGMGAGETREMLNIGSSLSLATSRRTMLEGGTVRNAYAGTCGMMASLALDLANAGFVGERDGIAHVFGRVVSESFDGEAMVRGLGESWEVGRNYFKLHACCRYNHAALDALAMLEKAHGLGKDIARIRSVDVASYSHAAELSDPSPRNALAARFSLPFAVATTLVNAGSGVDSFRGDALTNPATLELARKVAVREDPGMTAKLPGLRPASVTVTLDDGGSVRAEVETNRGDWQDPYTPAQLRGKYDNLVRGIWDGRASDAIHSLILGLEDLDDVRRLGRAMRQACAEGGPSG